MIGIVYDKDYEKYDLGTGHPLVGDKPKKTLEFFKEKGLMKDIKQFKPKKATEEDLKRVHSELYIKRVKSLSEKGGFLSYDTPAPKGIFDIALIPTGGTIFAGEKLFEGFSCMVNPLAGFHHASINSSSGFCFFNDVAIVIEYLRNKFHLQRFLIIDLDVHHFNGTQDIFYDDPSVLNISFHQDGKTLYPGTGHINQIGRYSGEGFTVNLPLPPGTGNESYQYAFDELIPPLTKQFNPEIIIYESGVDTHHTDPLASLKLTHQIYYHFGKELRNLSKKICNKLLILFGGGYNSLSSVYSYYNIMCGVMNKKDYIKEEEIKDANMEIVKSQVEELKNNLTGHWEL